MLEIIHNNCTDRLDWLSEVEANIASNIAILEGTIEGRLYRTSPLAHYVVSDNSAHSGLLEKASLCYLRIQGLLACLITIHL